MDKTSAGALEHMAVARVPNLVSAIETLKKNGLWIYGTAAEGSNELWKTDLTGPACIVIGSEGAGISRLVREKCDFLVSIRCAVRSPRSTHPRPQPCCSMRRCASGAERPHPYAIKRS